MQLSEASRDNRKKKKKKKKKKTPVFTRFPQRKQTRGGILEGGRARPSICMYHEEQEKKGGWKRKRNRAHQFLAAAARRDAANAAAASFSPVCLAIHASAACSPAFTK